MNKETFLLQLERLLYDIPSEERQEALEYYESYFQDAGEENEADVLKELGSPQKIAESIKEGLKDAGPTQYMNHPPQVRTNRQQGSTQSETYGYHGQQSDTQSETFKSNKQHTGTQSDTYEYGTHSGNYRRYYDKDPQQASSFGNSQSQSQRQTYGQYGKQAKNAGSGTDKSAKWILLLLAALLTAPLWGSIASVLLSICGIAIAAVVVLGIFAVGGVVGGLVCTVIGIVRLCMLSLIQGLVLLGVGMLLIAGGGISIVLLVLLCGKLLPWAVNQASYLFHKLWDWCLNLRHV